MPKLHPAAPTPCAECPWRVENHGKRHPHGWYTKKNLRRLWAGIRRGESMSCHPTDPNNEVPEGHRAAPETAETRECTGALILAQREMMRLVTTFDSDYSRYTASTSRGMTREGVLQILNRELYGGTPLGGCAMTKPNLNQEGIGRA